MSCDPTLDGIIKSCFSHVPGSKNRVKVTVINDAAKFASGAPSEDDACFRNNDLRGDFDNKLADYFFSFSLAFSFDALISFLPSSSPSFFHFTPPSPLPSANMSVTDKTYDAEKGDVEINTFGGVATTDAGLTLHGQQPLSRQYVVSIVTPNNSCWVLTISCPSCQT